MLRHTVSGDTTPAVCAARYQARNWWNGSGERSEKLSELSVNCGACLCPAAAAAAAAEAMEGAEVGPRPGSDGVEGQIRGGEGG